MSVNGTAQLDARHHRLPEKVNRADLRKAEIDWKPFIGGAIERTRMLLSLSLKEFAGLMPLPDGTERDERQIARWISGAERPQLDALFAVDAIRQPLVIALAELANAEIVTQITIRRRA